MEKNKVMTDSGNSSQKGTGRLDSMYHTALSNGRNGRLKIGERISLMIRGKQDARKGLLRETEAGWSSPTLASEKAAYEEFCAKTWAAHQIAMKGNYEEVRNLKERILRLKEEIRNLDREIGELRNKQPEIYRKFGEERVSEKQVLARRQREHAKRVGEKTRIRSELWMLVLEAREEMDRIRNGILEADHAVRMICEKVGDHTRLRMTVYWNAALKVHREADGIPTEPVLELPDDAERVYLSGHKEFQGIIPQAL